MLHCRTNVQIKPSINFIFFSVKLIKIYFCFQCCLKKKKKKYVLATFHYCFTFVKVSYSIKLKLNNFQLHITNTIVLLLKKPMTNHKHFYLFIGTKIICQ